MTELEKLELELAKVLLRSELPIGKNYPKGEEYERLLLKEKLNKVDELFDNPVIRKALDNGFNRLRYG